IAVVGIAKLVVMQYRRRVHWIHHVQMRGTGLQDFITGDHDEMCSATLPKYPRTDGPVRIDFITDLLKGQRTKDRVFQPVNSLRSQCRGQFFFLIATPAVLTAFAVVENGRRDLTLL